MVSINDNGYRGFPAVNHAQNVRGTETSTATTRTSIVYPRMKFTYLAEFVINTNAVSAFRTDLGTYLTSGRLYAPLESIELPKVSFEFETLRSYNKFVESPTTYKFEPSCMIFQDDNSSMAAALWLEYQSFYLYGGDLGIELGTPTNIINNYVRQGNDLVGANVRASMTTRPSLGVTPRFSTSRHFFNEIIIYDLGADPTSVNVYHYVCPVITNFTPDGMDSQNGSDYKKIVMNFKYEHMYFEVGQSANDITQWFDTDLGLDAGVSFATADGHSNMVAQPGSTSSDVSYASTDPTNLSSYFFAGNTITAAAASALSTANASTTASSPIVSTGDLSASAAQTVASPQMAATWVASGTAPLVNGVPTTNTGLNSINLTTLQTNPQFVSSAAALQADLNSMGLGVTSNQTSTVGPSGS